MDKHNHYTKKTNANIRMIIVDDEPIICEGLKQTIDWEQLGVEVVGVAWDGEQALEIVQAEAIDIVLSDIRMDGMDGLELAEQLRNQYPDINMIMISGYEDFDYARRAMRQGVIDYLLKPVNIDELKAVVSKVIERIHEEANTISPEEAELWFMNAIYSKSEFVETELVKQLKKFKGTYRILATQLTEFKLHYGELSADALKRLQDEWTEDIKSALDAAGLGSIFVFTNANLLYTFVYDKHRTLHEKDWNELPQQIAAGWKHDGRIIIAASDCFNDLEQTTVLCEQVWQMLPYHILLPQNESILTMPRCKAIESSRPSIHSYTPPADWATRLSGLLYRQECDEARTMVKTLLAELREHQLLLPELLEIYEEQMTLLRQRLRNNALQFEQNGERQSVDLHQYNSYELLEQLLLDDLHAWLELIRNQSVTKSYWIVEKAMKYVREHYSEDVKASEIAEWLNITPNHFSYIFKQNSGKNFKEFINDVRISQAQRLLASTNDKVFEIADQVGYKEYKYFVSVFKTVTGMTPKEYRAVSAGV